MKGMGKYLYAIVAGSGDRTYGPIGINGGVVHTRVEVEAGLHRLR